MTQSKNFTKATGNQAVWVSSQEYLQRLIPRQIKYHAQQLIINYQSTIRRAMQEPSTFENLIRLTNF